MRADESRLTDEARGCRELRYLREEGGGSNAYLAPHGAVKRGSRRRGLGYPGRGGEKRTERRPRGDLTRRARADSLAKFNVTCPTHPRLPFPVVLGHVLSV